MDSDGFVTTPTDEDDHSMGGKHRRYFFPNGYGASVIRHPFSYGYERGLYELAVLRGTARKAALTYDTPITDDVIGSLTPVDVELLLERIKALPAAQKPARRTARDSRHGGESGIAMVEAVCPQVAPA